MFTSLVAQGIGERSFLFNTNHLESGGVSHSKEQRRRIYLNSRLFHRISLVLGLVVMSRVGAGGGIMRPGLVAIDEIFVCNVIERLLFGWLEEETREFVAWEVI